MKELEQKAKEYKAEKDFINNLYGISDIDHVTALGVYHVYDLMKQFAQTVNRERIEQMKETQQENELIMMKRIEELEEKVKQTEEHGMWWVKEHDSIVQINQHLLGKIEKLENGIDEIDSMLDRSFIQCDSDVSENKLRLLIEQLLNK